MKCTGEAISEDKKLHEITAGQGHWKAILWRDQVLYGYGLSPWQSEGCM